MNLGPSLSALIERIPILLHRDSLDFPKDRIIDGRGAVAREMRREIKRRIKNPHLVVIDGNPGSGKSGMAEKIIDTSTKRGRYPLSPEQCFTFPMDLFLGTARGSQERERLKDCEEEFFREHYMRYSMAREALQFVLESISKEEEGALTIPQAYLREQGGTFGQTELKVPRGVRLVILEGVGSAHLLQGMDMPEVFETQKIFMYASVLATLLRASLRDVLKGSATDINERLRMHAAEYRHIVNFTGPYLTESNYICDRFPDSSFGDKLSKKNEAILSGEVSYSSGLTITSILEQLDEEALKIFGHLIPEELISGKAA